MTKDYLAKQKPQDQDVTSHTAFSTHFDICVRVLIIASQHRSGETHPARTGWLGESVSVVMLPTNWML